MKLLRVLAWVALGTFVITCLVMDYRDTVAEQRAYALALEHVQQLQQRVESTAADLERTKTALAARETRIAALTDRIYTLEHPPVPPKRPVPIFSRP